MTKRSQFVFGLLVLFQLLIVSYSIEAYGTLHTQKDQLLDEELASKSFDDYDLHSFILHNLGLLSSSNKLSKSAKEFISKFGTKNSLESQKINYMFLIEDEINSSNNKAMGIKFDLCATEDLEDCVLHLLYNRKNENSLINLIKEDSQKDVEAYLYTSSVKVKFPYIDSSLSMQTDNFDNVMIIDHGKKQAFNMQTRLDQCVNSIFQGKYSVDLENNTILILDGSNQIIQVKDKYNDELTSFINDLCSIVSISKLIEKNTDPSFFTFYLTSLYKLKRRVHKEDRNTLDDMIEIALNQFVQNVQSKYKDSQISGEIIFMDPEQSLESKFPDPDEEYRTNLVDTTRFLQQNPPTVTTVIVNSVLIIFVLVNLWIWIEMFNMSVHKDTIVYAKFLAEDYIRR